MANNGSSISKKSASLWSDLMIHPLMVLNWLIRSHQLTPTISTHNKGAQSDRNHALGRPDFTRTASAPAADARDGATIRRSICTNVIGSDINSGGRFPAWAADRIVQANGMAVALPVPSASAKVVPRTADDRLCSIVS